jgi:hypothetical protein
MDDIPYGTLLRQELVRGIARHHRRVRRRRILIATMSLLVVLVVGMGVATGAINWRVWPMPQDIPPGVEPVALGPEKTIATGSFDEQGRWTPWRLTAFWSDRGLCLHIETSMWKGGGCGFGVPEEAAISYTADSSFLYGPVDRRATRIEVRFEGGEVRSVEPIGRSAGFLVNFYLFELEPGEEAISVAAFDEGGKEVGEARLA